MDKNINNEKSNWFTGSMYMDKYATAAIVLRTICGLPDVIWVRFQPEGSATIAKHWQFTFRTKSGKQQRQSYYRKLLGWYKDGHMPHAGWISACNSIGKSCNYVKKSDTSLGSYIEWDINKGKCYTEFKIRHDWSDAKNIQGLLENKMQELEMLQERLNISLGVTEKSYP